MTTEAAGTGEPTAVIRVKLDGKTSSVSFEDKRAWPTLWGIGTLQTLKTFTATGRLDLLKEFLRDQPRGRYYPELDSRIYRMHLLERSTSLPLVLCGMVERRDMSMDEMRFAVSRTSHADLIPLQNLLKAVQKGRPPEEKRREAGTTLTVAVDLDREEVSVRWKGSRERFTFRALAEKTYSGLWEEMEDLEMSGREQDRER